MVLDQGMMFWLFHEILACQNKIIGKNYTCLSRVANVTSYNIIISYLITAQVNCSLAMVCHNHH
jgi:hypothetical protein